MKELFILEEDKLWAKNRIAELQQAILDLGPEFYDVFNQSSETWHDNAPFDALRDRQSVLDAELQQLKRILRQSAVGMPRVRKGAIGIGSVLTLEDGKGKQCTYRVVGDWTPRAGEVVDGQIIVSAQAPLVQDILGKKPGDNTPRGKIIEVV